MAETPGILSVVRDHYAWRGVHNLTALGIACTLLWGLPYLANIYWSRVMELGETTVFMLVAVGSSVGLFWLGSLLHLPIYYFNLFPQYKLSKKAWPWQGDEKRRARWWELIRKTMWQLLINQGILTPLLAVPTWFYVLQGWPFKGGFTQSPDAIPTALTLAWQMVVCMMSEDFFFYWSHRTLHHPRIYKYIHKRHHEYMDALVSIAAEYAHPVEFVAGNIIPFFSGPLILTALAAHGYVAPNHTIMWLCWVFVRIGETLDAHGGYDWPWSPYRLIPFSGSAEHHNFHHTVNKGNYGTFFIYMDHIFGTDKPYLQHLAKQGGIGKHGGGKGKKVE